MRVFGVEALAMSKQRVGRPRTPTLHAAGLTSTFLAGSCCIFFSRRSTWTLDVLEMPQPRHARPAGRDGTPGL